VTWLLDRRSSLGYIMSLCGSLEQAKHWLQATFEIDHARRLKPMALKDPDLEPLWKEIGSF